MHLYKLARMTNQLKENVIYWLNQDGTFNPADKLGKFDIDTDSVKKWMKLELDVLRPDWLQVHPKHYLHKMLKESSEKIKGVRSGGHIKISPNEETLLTHHCTELSESEDIMANYIEAQDYIRPVRKEKLDFHPLDIVVEGNGTKGSSYCMKIMGYVTYFAHKWVDKWYLKKYKVCEHSYHCECKKNLLAQRKLD